MSRDRATTAADAVMAVIRAHLNTRRFAAMREEITVIFRDELSDALWQARGERHLDD